MISSRIVVRRYMNRHEFGGVQRLERHWYLCNRLRVWVTVLDEEEYPAWADIARCTLGYNEWQSKFAEYIK